MPSVLFICTANRFRSPIASAWFSRCLHMQTDIQDWQVGSAGTWAKPGLSVFPAPGWISDHFGLDLNAHKAACVDRELLTRSDLTLVMEINHQEALRAEFPELKDRIFLLAQVATGISYDITDPDGKQVDSYLEIAQEITNLIDKGFDNICQLAHKLHNPA